MALQFSLRNLTSDENIALEQATHTLGRSAECDIVLETEEASRRHARLSIDAGELTLEDLDSTNGTYLNNSEIHGLRILNGGDVIGIGDQSFLVLTPSFTGEKTIFGARLGREESSYVMDNSGSDQTSMRMAYPSPPGWSASDQRDFGNSSTSRDEKTLTDLLNSSSIDSSNSAAALMVTNGRHRGSLYTLPRNSVKKQWTVGRINDSDITLDDITVSGTHAVITCEENEWSVEDQGSTNGTKVNSTRTKSSKLQRGDKLSFGEVALLFRVL